MAVTPRSRTTSANASPSKGNGRKQPSKVEIDLSDDDDFAASPSSKSGKAKSRLKAKEPIEIVDDDDNDDDAEEGSDGEEGGDEYEVEAVVGHRQKKGKDAYGMLYLIKWKGWPESSNTWEPEAHLPEDLVNAYWKKQPSKSQPKKFEKRKFQDSEDDIEPIEVDTDEDEDIKESKKASPAKAKRNGRARSSSTGSKRSSPSKSASGSARGAKRPRTSSSSRGRLASSSEDEDEDEDEDAEEEEESEADDPKPKRSGVLTDKEHKALERIRTNFLAHYVAQFDDWEDVVEGVINMQRNPDDDELRSHLQFRNTQEWRNAMGKISFGSRFSGKGPQLWVDNETANQRCPQKVIKFYESHLRFADTPHAAR